MNLVAQEIKGIGQRFPPRQSDDVALRGDRRQRCGHAVLPLSGRKPARRRGGQCPAAGRATPSPMQACGRDYVLSQDAYGSSVELLAARPAITPCRGWRSAGWSRLPSDIGGLIDAYVDGQRNGRWPISLVTGYDFLADAANAVTTELGAGTGHTPGHADRAIQYFSAGSGVVVRLPADPDDNRPISPASCSARRLHPSRHDVIFLAGHFSANSALAADYTTRLMSTDLTRRRGLQAFDLQCGLSLGL